MIRFIKIFKNYFSSRKIFVYTLGKVGSRTVKDTLDELEIPSRHFHSIDISQQKNGIKYLVHAFLLRISLKISKKNKIITLIRDPISRDLSYLFHMFQRDLEYRGKVKTFFKSSKSDQELEINNYIKSYKVGLLHQDWFDQEFKKYTGIDVFNYKFPVKKNILWLIDGKYEILILRTEKLSRLEPEISQFLGIKNFEGLIHSNISTDKMYGESYKYFTKTKFSPEYLNKVYNTKFSKHFFSPVEIQNLKNKWKYN